MRQLIDPADWRWDGEGREPTIVTRQTPKVVAQRLRYGKYYGRPSSWFRLQRV